MHPVSRQDPGAASGQQVYPPLTRCVCGDLVTLHGLSESGKRTSCSSSNCACKTFTEEVGRG